MHYTSLPQMLVKAALHCVTPQALKSSLDMSMALQEGKAQWHAQHHQQNG